MVEETGVVAKLIEQIQKDSTQSCATHFFAPHKDLPRPLKPRRVGGVVVESWNPLSSLASDDKKAFVAVVDHATNMGGGKMESVSTMWFPPGNGVDGHIDQDWVGRNILVLWLYVSAVASAQPAGNASSRVRLQHITTWR